jgi:hypothetical protein
MWLVHSATGSQRMGADPAVGALAGGRSALLPHVEFPRSPHRHPIPQYPHKEDIATIRAAHGCVAKIHPCSRLRPTRRAALDSACSLIDGIKRVGGEVDFGGILLGCEGIASKRLGSLYRSGRSPHWIKVKNPRRQRRSLRLDAQNSEHLFVPTRTKCVLITVASQ